MSFARRPLVVACMVAAAAAGAVGLAPAPSTKSARLIVTDAVSGTRVASIAPTLDWATPDKSFLLTSVALAPADTNFGRKWYQRFEGGRQPAAAKAAAPVAKRTGRVAKRLAPAPSNAIAAASDTVEVAAAPTVAEVPWPAPLPERFAGSDAPVDAGSPPVILAYADPAPGSAVGAFEALTGGDGDEVVSDESAGDGDSSSEVPIPSSRPKFRESQAAKPVEDKPATAVQDADDLRPETAPAPGRDKEQKLAYARPDDPTRDSGGSWLGRLFEGKGRSQAGDGVAVYDISAAKVYMPDGSTLEAHSGIGKMADNPRYVNVKMNGPTPPHTYVLKMREKRFHGVEAIRMLPIDGKNKHGRDGFLTHSYLLRGKREESHGCVAFANYPKFLAAFKAGKVKQLVVVPGGGKSAAVRLAKNGRGA